MSNIHLSKSKKLGKGDRVILCASVKELKDYSFSKAEMDYLSAQEKSSKKTITVNHFGSFSFVQLIDVKKTDALTMEACRVAGNAIVVGINLQKIKKIQVIDAMHSKQNTLALVEGIALGNYQFLKYRGTASTEKNSLEEISILSDVISERDVQLLNASVEGVYTARTLVNEPLSYLTAVQMGKDVVKLGKEHGFKVEVLNKAKIEALKMGGLLAVNKGSIDPPAFIIMEYKPKGAVNKQPIVLVGKGVVYDTGGLSLKPSDGMMTMKCDMGGAAAVIGAMIATSKSELPVWVVGLVPATDNRPDGNAIVPGDVITISDGTTVEVLNTDAEGRLILSDALVYAKKFNPAFVIDLATLTGAAARAIGKYGIVAMGTADKEFADLKVCGDQVHERLVEFPLWDDYSEMLKSDIADIKNIGGAIAGANTAGKFLERFTSYPWVHLDIAGPAFVETPDSYRGKGGTGSGARLLFQYLRNISNS
jgi:leucyl aminopeptidase